MPFVCHLTQLCGIAAPPTNNTGGNSVWVFGVYIAAEELGNTGLRFTNSISAMFVTATALQHRDARLDGISSIAIIKM